MVTRTMWEQSHTTPVTSTWTADFLTREGEGRKTMGDWLHDKLIPWKACRCLLQTNSGIFPCESRLQKWGKNSDGICGLCKRCRDMGLGLLGGKPARGTTGHLQSSVCRLQAVRAQCLTILLLKHFALCGTITGNVNSDRGFESWTGYEFKPPDCHSSLEAHGLLVTGFPATGRIFGRRADVAHPRPGSFGSHGHRIDFCETTRSNRMVFSWMD
jgi:hypothetical protein